MPTGGKPGRKPGTKKTGGRVRGTPNKRTTEVEAYAKSILEDPRVQDKMIEQAQDGTLSPPIMALLFYYAYGKPVERHEHGGDANNPLQVIIRRATI